MNLFVEADTLIQGEAEMKSGKRNVERMERITSFSILGLMLLNLCVGTAIAKVGDGLWTLDSKKQPVKAQTLSEAEHVKLSKTWFIENFAKKDEAVIEKGLRKAVENSSILNNGVMFTQAIYLGLKEVSKKPETFKAYQELLNKVVTKLEKDEKTDWGTFPGNNEPRKKALLALFKKLTEIKHADFEKFADDEALVAELFLKAKDAADFRKLWEMQDNDKVVDPFEELKKKVDDSLAKIGTDVDDKIGKAVNPLKASIDELTKKMTGPVPPGPVAPGPTVPGEQKDMESWLDRIIAACKAQKEAAKAREEKALKDVAALTDGVAKAISEMGKQPQKREEGDGSKALKDQLARLAGKEEKPPQNANPAFPSPVSEKSDDKKKGGFDRAFNQDQRPPTGAGMGPAYSANDARPIPGQIVGSYSVQPFGQTEEKAGGDRVKNRLEDAMTNVSTLMQTRRVRSRSLINRLDPGIKAARKKAQRMETVATNMMKYAEKNAKNLDNLVNQGGLAKIDELERQIPKRQRKADQMKQQGQQCLRSAQGDEEASQECYGYLTAAQQIETSVEDMTEELALGKKVKDQTLAKVKAEVESLVSESSELKEAAEDLRSKADEAEGTKAELAALAEQEDQALFGNPNGNRARSTFGDRYPVSSSRTSPVGRSPFATSGTNPLATQRGAVQRKNLGVSDRTNRSGDGTL